MPQSRSRRRRRRRRRRTLWSRLLQPRRRRRCSCRRVQLECASRRRWPPTPTRRAGRYPRRRGSCAHPQPSSRHRSVPPRPAAGPSSSAMRTRTVAPQAAARSARPPPSPKKALGRAPSRVRCGADECRASRRASQAGSAGEGAALGAARRECRGETVHPAG